jgi:DNA-binding MarR family transcriptional regulator
MEKWKVGIAPLGLYFSFLNKHFAGVMVQKMSHIDLDKYFRVLVVIEQSQETFTQQRLSDYFKTSKVSMVRIIDHLTDKGYLRRKVNTKDRREHFLILTAKAQQELPLIRQALQEIEASALKGFTEEQKEQFFQLMDKVHTNITQLASEELFISYEKVEKKTRTTAKPSVETEIGG